MPRQCMDLGRATAADGRERCSSVVLGSQSLGKRRISNKRRLADGSTAVHAYSHESTNAFWSSRPAAPASSPQPTTTPTLVWPTTSMRSRCHRSGSFDVLKRLCLTKSDSAARGWARQCPDVVELPWNHAQQMSPMPSDIIDYQQYGWSISHRDCTKLLFRLLFMSLSNFTWCPTFPYSTYAHLTQHLGSPHCRPI